MTNEAKLYKELQKELKKAYESRFYFFVKKAFAVLHNGEKMVENWHIKLLCDVIQNTTQNVIKKQLKYTPCENIPLFTEHKNLLVNVPPRSLKSFIVSVCLPAWSWIHKPNMRFIVSSHSMELSLELSVLCRDLIRSDWYIDNFNELEIAHGKDTKTIFGNQFGGVRQSVSTGGNVTGKGCDILVIDDNINTKDANSEIAMKTGITHYTKTLQSRFNNLTTGIFIIIEQRTNTQDLTGYIKETDYNSFNHLCLPAELTKDVTPEILKEKYSENLLFPARLPQTELDKLKKRMLSDYTGQYLQTPVKDGGNILKSEYFPILSKKEIPPMFESNWFMVVDGAYTDKNENDPTGILIAAEFDNKLYIKYFEAFWKLPSEAVTHIINIAESYNFDYTNEIIIEPKASGLGFVDNIKKLTDIPCRAIGKSHANHKAYKDMSKLERCHTIQPKCAAGDVILIEGNWNSSFLASLEAFPNGTHDEELDCLAYACEKAFKRKRMLS